ncbi:MAG: PEP-CTERM sorting domain-containing protein [Verrucomicrobia bacterium]|nr:PEP-CTERM sorting domain-containing protein [Verrucomicrobiota bacterium]
MKKSLLTLGCLLVGAVAYGQGTINFANIAGAAVNAPVTQNDGLTRLAGAQFQVQLLAGSSADSLTAIATAPFQTGGGAGYFVGGTQVVPGVAGGATAWVQILAWDTTAGASYAAALASGMDNVYGFSGIFSVVTGNPNAEPPGTPALLTGLESFSLVVVPEPSTIALAGLGLAGLLLFRRRK